MAPPCQQAMSGASLKPIRRLASLCSSGNPKVPAHHSSNFAGPSVNCQIVSAPREVVAAAQGRRRQDDYDYVELDDAYEPRDRGFSLDVLPALSGKVFGNLAYFTDRFVDVVYQFFPAGTSRSVVETASKGGILLVTLAFASSILSFMLNVGAILLAAYIFTKVFNIDASVFSQNQGGRGISSRSSPARRSKPRRKKTPKVDLGQAAADVTDVWFEPKPRKGRKGSKAVE